MHPSDSSSSATDLPAPSGSSPVPRVPTVVFVSSHAALGGSEQVLQDLLRSLPPGSVGGVVSLQTGPLVDRLRSDGVEVAVHEVGAGPLRAAGSALRLGRRLRRSAPDVVHANGSKAALLAVLARPGAPVVWMKHDVYRDGRVSRLVARRCAAVAGVSQTVLEDVAGSGRTRVVHPGVRVDTDRARAEGEQLRRHLGLSGPVVAVIGRLDPAKGHRELLEALPALRRAVPDACALLVGGDDPAHPGVREQLQARARELGVADAALLPGHLPSLAVLGAVQAVCVPTVPDAAGRGQEGFGLVAAEALAVGVPVLGYDVGATAEVLGGCGRLVPEGDRGALAAQLAEVLAGPGAGAAMVAAGRRRAGELTPERTAQQMLDLYREVSR